MRKRGVHKKSNGVVAILVAAILIIIGAALWWFLPQKEGTSNGGVTPIYAAAGELVPSFPKELLIDGNAVKKSYTISYSNTLNQYTAELDSSSSMDTIFKDYWSYLIGNGWQITNSATSSKNFEGIYAVNSSSEVNVTFTPNGSGTHVVVGFLQK